MYGKPLVASVQDLRRVVAEAIPSMPKVSEMTREEMAKAAIPYLAKALGIPEDHPSLEVFQSLRDDPADPIKVDPTELAKVPVDEPNAVEGASKNVMDIALSNSKPKTEDLEDITTKVKEAALKHKSPQAIYDAIKHKFAGVDKRDLRILVNRIASDTFIQQSMDNTGKVYTEVSTSNKDFGNQLAQLAKSEIGEASPALTDGVVDIDEMASMPQDTDEFDAIQGFIQ
jgi:hypothetical protein